MLPIRTLTDQTRLFLIVVKIDQRQQPQRAGLCIGRCAVGAAAPFLKTGPGSTSPRAGAVYFDCNSLSRQSFS